MTKLYVGNLPFGATAMQALNGKEFEGRALKVNEARERATDGNRGGPRY